MLETQSREADAASNTSTSISSEDLPPRMLDLVPLTLDELRKSPDPELKKAVAGIISAAALGKFGDNIQQQRD